MKTFVSAAIFGICAANELQFLEHIADYNLSYGTREEFEFRLERFIEAESRIQALNIKYEDASFAHTFLSTWTEEEKNRMRGGMPHEEDDMEARDDNAVDNHSTLSSVDWRNKGAVTAVQNQGGCGSCWAFGSTAALEGNYKIRHGSLIKMSEQQLVDCVTACYGCDGGWDYKVYDYLYNHKYETESAYPYTGRDDRCKYDSTKGKYTVSSYTRAGRNDY